MEANFGVVIIYSIGSFLLCLFVFFSNYLLLRKNIEWKNYKIYIAALVGAVIGTTINFFMPQYLKLFLVIILLVLLDYIFICKDLTKSILVVIMAELIVVICELLITILISLFVNNDINSIGDSLLCITLINIGVPVLASVFIQIPITYKIYSYLYKTFNNMKQSNLIVYFVIIIVLIILFFAMAYMELPSIFLLICNTILTILYVIVIVKMANARVKFNKINGKYETSLSSLKEYENIMDQYRVDNHENKNQLLTIRNMVKAKDKTVIKYIDKLVDNKIKDNENIFYKTSKIPEGGLRATIYSKLCKMKDSGIEYSLEIANDIRTVDLIKMGDATMLNICKIIGVFLDNAIEAVEDLDEKDIIVEIFVMDSDLCIEISNNYREEIAIDKISNKGYSTKGQGHGYGLSLVSELIKQDSNLENEREISKDLFTQRLKIKM